MSRKILITNDDGITSDGIVRLARAAKDFGEVWVVAPDEERSGASHSVILRHSFDAWEVDFPVEGVHAFACTGFPADCVRIGVLNIVKGKPDNVFSGIHYGYNMTYSIRRLPEVHLKQHFKGFIRLHFLREHLRFTR